MDRENTKQVVTFSICLSFKQGAHTYIENAYTLLHIPCSVKTNIQLMQIILTYKMTYKVPLGWSACALGT